MNKNEIYIAMSTNDNYAPFLATSIQSILFNSSSKYKYNFCILYTDLNDENKNKIASMISLPNSIEFSDVSNYMKDIHVFEQGYLTKEAVYRLLIGKVLRKKCNKVIYLDCDTVINRDLSDLYVIDLEEAIIGAVKDIPPIESLNYYKNELKLEINEVMNSGVLLIDINAFNHNAIGEKGMDMLQKKPYRFMDNDVLNILCKDKIKWLDTKWNVEWHFEILGDENMFIDSDYYRRKKDINNPYIIHYTSSKPWEYIENLLAQYFWKYAMATPFWHEILKRHTAYMTKKLMSIDMEVLNIRQDIEKHLSEGVEKFIIYPFGNIGRQVKFLLNNLYGINENYIIDNKLAINNPNIKTITFLNNINISNYCLIFACINDNVFKQLNDELLQKVANEKIIYVKKF